jgi:DNA-directed RNA polymerase specialized sigma24 family protein
MSFGQDFASTLADARPKEGEDLASEVWLDIASGLNRFKGTESDLLCWIFTIARRRLNRSPAGSDPPTH